MYFMFPSLAFSFVHTLPRLYRSSGCDKQQRIKTKLKLFPQQCNFSFKKLWKGFESFFFRFFLQNFVALGFSVNPMILDLIVKFFKKCILAEFSNWRRDWGWRITNLKRNEEETMIYQSIFKILGFYFKEIPIKGMVVKIINFSKCCHSR